MSVNDLLYSGNEANAPRADSFMNLNVRKLRCEELITDVSNINGIPVKRDPPPAQNFGLLYVDGQFQYFRLPKYTTNANFTPNLLGGTFSNIEAKYSVVGNIIDIIIKFNLISNGNNISFDLPETSVEEHDKVFSVRNLTKSTDLLCNLKITTNCIIEGSFTNGEEYKAQIHFNYRY